MMNTQSENAIEPLRQYLSGSITTDELERTLAESEYDDRVASDVRDLLAGVRLTIIEATEGLVDKESVLKEAARTLALLQPGVKIMSARSSASNSSSTSTTRATALTAGQDSVVRVRISA